MSFRIATLLLIATMIGVGWTGPMAATLASADDPSSPASPVKLIFIHHSTGENWLADEDGGLGVALRDNNYFVSDTNYGWGPDGIGDTTDIGHWWTWFRGPRSERYMAALYAERDQHAWYARMASDPGGENEIVLFKSCFPNSHLGGNPDDPPTSGANPLRGQDAWSEYHTVANAKGIYNDILAYFATRQDRLFVVITAPPLMQSDTDAAHAANARAFNNWLVNEWLDGYPHRNVAVFDFYNILTSNGGNRSTNDLGWPAGNHHRWWGGAVQHIQTVNNNYSAYWGGIGGGSHPSPAGNRKATGEFIPLLNVFYHRWKGSADTATPTATAATLTPTSTRGVTPSRSPTPTRTPVATLASATPMPTASSTATPTNTPPSGQQTLIFQNSVSPDPAYDGTADAIITTWSGNSYANLGGLDYLQIGETGEADEFRFLVRFELGGWLPMHAQIDQAWLELRAYDGEYDGGSRDVVAHRIDRAWAEGEGWDLFADGRNEGVTWVTARPGVSWTSPGGDFDAAEIDRTTVGANPNDWYRWNVTSVVQAWADATRPNYGFLLEPENGPWLHHQFRASEYSDRHLRPRLAVVYSVAPPSTPPGVASYLPLLVEGY